MLRALCSTKSVVKSNKLQINLKRRDVVRPLPAHRGEEKMEWSPTEMIQQAKEELELLETHHPNRFQYLKLDLKAFILLLQSQQPSSSTVTVATQASSTGSKRKRGGGKFGRAEEGDRRVDMVLERAESCLQKIRKLKSTLC